MANVRINVRVTDLIASVEKQRDAAKKKQDKAASEYDAAFEKWRQSAIKWAQEVKPDAPRRYPPDMPYRERGDTAKFDRDLALLRMCSDETIAITGTSDFYKYIA